MGIKIKIWKICHQLPYLRTRYDASMRDKTEQEKLRVEQNLFRNRLTVFLCLWKKKILQVPVEQKKAQNNYYFQHKPPPPNKKKKIEIIHVQKYASSRGKKEKKYFRSKLKHRIKGGDSERDRGGGGEKTKKKCFSLLIPWKIVLKKLNDVTVQDVLNVGRSNSIRILKAK